MAEDLEKVLYFDASIGDFVKTGTKRESIFDTSLVENFPVPNDRSLFDSHQLTSNVTYGRLEFSINSIF